MEKYILTRVRTISILVVFITMLVMAGILIWYKNTIEKIDQEMNGQEDPVTWSP